MFNYVVVLQLIQLNINFLVLVKVQYHVVPTLSNISQMLMAAGDGFRIFNKIYRNRHIKLLKGFDIYYIYIYIKVILTIYK